MSLLILALSSVLLLVLIAWLKLNALLAVCSGRLMFSHFNDTGFWMFKEYYNVSIKHTSLIWTVMERIVAVVGLVGVLAFNALLPGGAAIGGDQLPAGGGWATTNPEDRSGV